MDTAIPIEIWMLVWTQLDYRTVIRCSEVCAEWKHGTDAVIKQRMSRILGAFNLTHDFLEMCDLLDIYIRWPFTLQLYYDDPSHCTSLDLYTTLGTTKTAAIRRFLIRRFLKSRGYSCKPSACLADAQLCSRGEHSLNIIAVPDTGIPIPRAIMSATPSLHVNWFHQGCLFIHSPYHVSKKEIEIQYPIGRFLSAAEYRQLLVSVVDAETRGFRFDGWKGLAWHICGGVFVDRGEMAAFFDNSFVYLDDNIINRVLSTIDGHLHGEGALGAERVSTFDGRRYIPNGVFRDGRFRVCI